MKKWTCWLLVLVSLLAVPMAMGSALITKGSSEMAISGKLNFHSETGTNLDMGLRYGYFVMDRVSLGTRITLGNNKYWHYFSIGFMPEYNFRMPQGYKPLFGTDLVPYIGAMVDYRYANIDDSESAIVLGGEGGLKFFLTDTSAVTLSMVGELASEDVYYDESSEKGETNKNLYLQIGMRFYF